MARMIFVNLPVTDLARSTAFYEAVGGRRNPRFSDGEATCIVFSDTIHAMLLTHDRWRRFTSKGIPDARESAQVMVCLSADSREAVDGTIAEAAAAGTRIDPVPIQDFGFMYGRSFEDPDGHIWEVMWMDAEAARAATAPQARDA